MQSKSTLRTVSQARAFKPRLGQSAFLKKLLSSELPPKGFAGQFPTGYGKTIIAAMAFKALFQKGLVNRMLLIVANNQQANQARADFSKDCKFVGLDGVECWPVANNGAASLASIRNDANVFITTVQGISAAFRGGVNCITQLLEKHKWFVVADEYHHYGDGKDWGNAVKSTCEMAEHYLALSATPFNRSVDTVFGKPDFVWSYAEALEEGAVKFFELKGAKYAATLVDQDNNPEDLTTCELRERVDPDKFSKKRGLRYSDKYVQPVLRRAINSLVEKRAATGMRLQMLVRAHGCFHAACVSRMLAEITNYKVDWVGSGEFGRKDFDNESILKKFVPGKDNHNNRKEPELDILVQVGMCGEGSDTVNVVEIVDLSLSTYMEPANTDRQFFGRGARVIRDSDGNPVLIGGKPVTCTVWVPTDSPIAKLHGHTQFQKWIDHTPLEKLDADGSQEDGVDSESNGDIPDLFISTEVFTVKECELIEIQEGDEFQEFVNNSRMKVGDIDLDNESHMAVFAEIYRKVRKVENEERDRFEELERNKFLLNEQVKKMTGHIMRLMMSKASSAPKSLYGDISKRVNKHIAKQFAAYRSEITSPSQVAEILAWLSVEAQRINQTKQPPMWAI